jgi:hypothetical protein
MSMRRVFHVFFFSCLVFTVNLRAYFAGAHTTHKHTHTHYFYLHTYFQIQMHYCIHIHTFANT